MARSPCRDDHNHNSSKLTTSSELALKKGPWTPEEDIILVSYVQQHGASNWRSVPAKTGLLRCSKSCRLRWTNYLRPGIKRGNFTEQEQKMIIHLQCLKAKGRRAQPTGQPSKEASRSAIRAWKEASRSALRAWKEARRSAIRSSKPRVEVVFEVQEKRRRLAKGARLV
ncbi:unnamed protein product [Rhodiola kirilowii]